MSEFNPGSLNYISYGRALALLKGRLDTTPTEVAAWIDLGPQHGGLSAYLSANELTDPPRFFFSRSGDDGDAYLEDLAHAWFRLDEIEAFRPSDRYITGADLRARWSHIPDKHGYTIDAYIMARIQESRLMDQSPCTGLSQWSLPERPWATSRAMALFCLAHVEAIESEEQIAPCAIRDAPQSADATHQQKSGGPIFEQRQQALVDWLQASEIPPDAWKFLKSRHGYSLKKIYDALSQYPAFKSLHGSGGAISRKSFHRSFWREQKIAALD